MMAGRKDLFAAAVSIAGLLLCVSCATYPGQMPTLQEYTDGAAAFAGPVAELFRTAAAGSSFPEKENAFLCVAARQWRDQASGGGNIEVSVTDFARKGRENASLRVRVVLEGLATDGPAGERLYADESFELRLRNERGSWKLLGSRPAGPLPIIRRGVPRLKEVAARIGLGEARHHAWDPAEKTNYCIPATHHHPGVVLADFDGDGSIDLLLPGEHPQLFLNDGHGHFRDATRGSGLDVLPPGEGAGGVAADLDGDGLPEIFLTYAYAPCRLLHNDGHGHFHDITAQSGLAGLVGTYTSAVFFDADGDGKLDLFVANYGDARETGPAYSGKNGPGSRFFHNVGTKNRPFFVDETESAGITDTGWAFAAEACDFNNSGRDSLYVANDFGTNVLYENISTPGHPKFRQIAKEAGVLDDGYGMGVTWGDYTNDGRFDLAVSDFSSPYRWMIRSPLLPMPPVPRIVAAIARPIVVPMLLRRCQGDGLYLNRGDGTFEKTSASAGVADGGWAWGTEFADLEGDGRLDLLVVNGMWEAAPGGKNDEVAFWNGMARQGIAFHDGYWGGINFGENGMASQTRKHLYHNLGGGKFEDDAYLDGFDTRGDTRGLAIGDLDGDGAPDVVVATFRGPLLVYHNEWKSNRLTLHLVGGQPLNREAIGAVAKLEANGLTQMREVHAGSSYLSESALDLYFGLGEAASADAVEVHWPDGKVEVRRGIPAGRLVWVEGETPPSK